MQTEWLVILMAACFGLGQALLLAVVLWWDKRRGR